MQSVFRYIKVAGERILEIYSTEPKNISEYIEIDVDDSIQDIEVLMFYIYEDGQIYKTDKYVQRKKHRVELKEIQIWLSNNDWKANKIVTGEWETTDQRWLDYLAERSAKRARQDELTLLLAE